MHVIAVVASIVTFDLVVIDFHKNCSICSQSFELYLRGLFLK